MTALALMDEQPGLAQAEVFHPQAEDLAPAHPPQEHGLDHRKLARLPKDRDQTGNSP